MPLDSASSTGPRSPPAVASTRLRAPSDFAQQRGRLSLGGYGTRQRDDALVAPTESGVPASSGGGGAASDVVPSSAPGAMGGGSPLPGGAASGRTGGGGHIRVAVRVRPLPTYEEGIIEVAGAGAIAIRKGAATGGNQFLLSQQGRIEERSFDQVFGPEAPQSEVYDWTCKPLITEAVSQGRSATVFVYGATGAGKTHTMFGVANEPAQHGIIFRAIPEVFRCLQEMSGTFEIKVSILEIYNEVVRDLLQQNEGGSDGLNSTCRVLEDAQRGVVKVSNLLEVPVSTPDEAARLLVSGMQMRTVEATAANGQSSRGHAVFTMTIEQVREQVGQGPFARKNYQVRTLHSKISLIDLAGSERAAITQNSGNALKDGARINQSLLALANCIDALTQRGPIGSLSSRKKPPYRDSKLTLMLKSSLTGDGLIAMIANVHPGRKHFEDSNNTLEYAKRASTVRSSTSRRLSRTTAPHAASWSQPVLPLQTGALAPESLEAPSAEAADMHDELCGTSSSSCSSLRNRRRSKDQCQAAVGFLAGESGDPTTASSHEECMSEISLSVGARESSTSPEGSSDVPGRCFGRQTSSGREAAGPSADAKESCPDGCGNDGSSAKFAAEEAGNPALLRLLATLQAEKAELRSYLASVIGERDALLVQRRELEQANEILRTASAEKDEQLRDLLAAATSVTSKAA
eukprot:TRINITY_DN12468_c0_g1_i2.p1 TRINITY_DN12468_c0_g1~~TRINITY_DN12468_c0_g1_i2.p1  ORF type:complete len:689 (-),score=140.54 TRINITY_DN12468_c0_g1_i2:79-2145(-)